MKIGSRRSGKSSGMWRKGNCLNFIHLGGDSEFVTPRSERRTNHEALVWRLPAQTADLRC